VKFAKSRRLNFRLQAPRLTERQTADLLKLGDLRGDWLYLAEQDYWAFRARVLSERQAHPLPPLRIMALNAVKALGRTLAQAATGRLVTVEAETEKLRLDLCLNCEHLRPHGRCSKCGCRTGGVVGKARLTAEHCPIGKW
jgi:hypothetical protein